MKIAIYMLLILICSPLYSIDFKNRKNQGIIEYEKLDENSGMVVGNNNPDIIWSANDGSANEIYGFDNTGKSRSILKFDKDLLEQDADIEDIAITYYNNKSYIVMGDIGDNDEIRTVYNIYMIPEPEKKDLEDEIKIKDKDVLHFKFVYEDGPHDTECLIVNPKDNSIYIITKRDKQARLYECTNLKDEGFINTFKYCGEFIFGNNLESGYTGINAGDITKDGKYILLRDYNNVWYYEINDGETLKSILNKLPQRIDSYNYSFDLEPQGEAICWDANGLGFYTASEEKSFENYNASLFYFESNTTNIGSEELELTVTSDYIDNRMNIPLKYSIYDYLGRTIYTGFVEPKQMQNYNLNKNQAYYLIIDIYNKLYRIN